MRHRGRAVVFEEHRRTSRRTHRRPVPGHRARRTIMVLKRLRPQGLSGVSGSGQLCRFRRSCSSSGVRDMVRISDARMSGTAYARRSCTSRRRPLPAATSPWSKTVTRSNSTSRRACCTCTSTRPNWRDAARSGNRHHRAWHRVTSASTTTTCCRPTAVAIWTSWSAVAAPTCRARATDPRAKQAYARFAIIVRKRFITVSANSPVPAIHSAFWKMRGCAFSRIAAR